MIVKSWSGDVQFDDNPAAICGLEISFTSIVPQDIDIKLIPGNNINNTNSINNPGELLYKVSQNNCAILLDLFTTWHYFSG